MNKLQKAIDAIRAKKEELAKEFGEKACVLRIWYEYQIPGEGIEDGIYEEEVGSEEIDERAEWFVGTIEEDIKQPIPEDIKNFLIAKIAAVAGWFRIDTEGNIISQAGPPRLTEKMAKELARLGIYYISSDCAS